MTAPGNPVTADGLNAEAIAVSQLMAIAAGRGRALAKKVDALGVTGLQGAGFTQTADAQKFLSDVDTLRSYALTWSGEAAVANPFDFSNALAAYVGVNPFGATQL